jgi:hypothetical protein
VSTTNDTPMVSSMALAEVLVKIGNIADSIDRTARNLQKDAERTLEALANGHHLSGYSHQTMTEATSQVAVFESLTNVYVGLSQADSDRDALAYVLTCLDESAGLGARAKVAYRVAHATHKALEG